jgi:hypothetical protein
MFQSLKSSWIYFYRALRTAALSLFSRSDVERWGRADSLNPGWDSRTRLIASLIPEGSSVLEFGAGRLSLKGFLPASCRYTPSDITDRGEGTIVCDLNSAVLPPFPYHDIVVFGGVLEYIFDVDRLLEHLTGSCGVIIASYAATDFDSQQTAIQRRKHGWVNDFSKEEFVRVFSRHGFGCGQTITWETQYLFRFTRE